MKKSGYRCFQLRTVCLSFKNFCRKTFGISESFGYRKFLWIRGGGGEERVSRFSADNFFVSQYQNVSYTIEKIMDERGGREGVSRFSIEYFLSQNTEMFPRTFLCFKKTLVPKNFMDKREGGEYHDFLSDIFFSLYRKTSQGKTPVSEFSYIRGVGYHDFPS